MVDRFAPEVAGIELLEGSVDVVVVESDARHDPVVSGDLDEPEQLRLERPRALVIPREVSTKESKVPSAGCDHDRLCAHYAELGNHTHACDFGISTASHPGVDDSAAIVRHSVVGQELRHAVPVAGRKARVEAVVHLFCRVFQPSRRSTEFVETG